MASTRPEELSARTAKYGQLELAEKADSNPALDAFATGERAFGLLPARSCQAGTLVAPFQLANSLVTPPGDPTTSAGFVGGWALHRKR